MPATFAVEEATMHYWLMKTEPGDFSIDDLARAGTEPWSGVRNYQARNYMRDAMRPGDRVLLYHSNCDPPGVSGVGVVVGDAYPDPTQFEKRSKYFDPKSTRREPRWLLVDVGFKRKFKRIITLDEIRVLGDDLGDFPLLRRGNRLSVLPVTTLQWRLILALE